MQHGMRAGQSAPSGVKGKSGEKVGLALTLAPSLCAAVDQGVGQRGGLEVLQVHQRVLEGAASSSNLNLRAGKSRGRFLPSQRAAHSACREFLLQGTRLEELAGGMFFKNNKPAHTTLKIPF